MSASANSRIGTELAGYRLEALIGRGGMGVVYRARDLALDRDVALKLLAPHLADDVSFRERFLRESRLAASLEHPNVVPIHDAGEIDGQLYIAMRLVEGSDLKAVLREGPLEPARAVGVLEEAEEDLTAFYAFPADHWTKLRSTNPLERVNREIGRRTDVVGIFPNDRSLIRLAASVVIEQNDEWLVGRRYLSAHSLEALLDQEKEDNDREETRELTAA
jgi:hypothetical protein